MLKIVLDEARFGWISSDLAGSHCTDNFENLGFIGHKSIQSAANKLMAGAANFPPNPNRMTTSMNTFYILAGF